MTRWLGVLSIALATTGLACFAAEEKKPAFTDPAKAGKDFALQGEYEGEMTVNEGKKKLGGQVIALGDGKFKVRLLPGGLPGDGWDGALLLEADAETIDGKTLAASKQFKAEIADGKMSVTEGLTLDNPLKRVVRKSKTLGEKPPKDAVVLFDGKSADEWEGGKIVEENLLNNGIKSKKKFKDFKAHVE